VACWSASSDRGDLWFAWGVRVLVMTWASGGNLPPLLAAASLLDRRGHEVTVLGSGETRAAARRLGLDVTGYQRRPDPDADVAFEAQAELMMATMAGSQIALDARDALAELRPDLAVVDCMLPAAIAAARATGTPAASLVHFLYGLARTQMLRAGGGWTTDLRTLAATHRMLGLTVATDGLSAWEPLIWCWSARRAGSTSTATRRQMCSTQDPWASATTRPSRRLPGRGRRSC
jgi:hypothetical protein